MTRGRYLVLADEPSFYSCNRLRARLSLPDGTIVEKELHHLEDCADLDRAKKYMQSCIRAGHRNVGIFELGGTGAPWMPVEGWHPGSPPEVHPAS